MRSDDGCTREWGCRGCEGVALVAHEVVMVARGSDVGGSWGGKERWLPNKKKEKEEEEEGNRGRKRSQRNKKMTELGSENGKGRRRNERCGVFFYEGG